MNQRVPAQPQIDSIIRSAAAEMTAAAASAIRKAFAAQVAHQLMSALDVLPAAPARRVKALRRPIRGREITRWVADNRARRVPTFVIEMTGGIDTKKKIVAKYGANAAFELGKPLPAVASVSTERSGTGAPASRAQVAARAPARKASVAA